MCPRFIDHRGVRRLRPGSFFSSSAERSSNADFFLPSTVASPFFSPSVARTHTHTNTFSPRRERVRFARSSLGNKPQCRGPGADKRRTRSSFQFFSNFNLKGFRCFPFYVIFFWITVKDKEIEISRSVLLSFRVLLVFRVCNSIILVEVIFPVEFEYDGFACIWSLSRGSFPCN